jgi:hypothetical protein
LYILHQAAALRIDQKNSLKHRLAKPFTATMARYYSEADYCSEEMARPYDSHCHGEGGGGYVVRKEEYEEIDEVERARRGHHHGHGHYGHSGSHREHLGHGVSYSHGASGHLGHSGSHLEQHHHGHGYGGSHCEPYETKVDSCTGEYYR